MTEGALVQARHVEPAAAPPALRSPSQQGAHAQLIHIVPHSGCFPAMYLFQCSPQNKAGLTGLQLPRLFSLLSQTELQLKLPFVLTRTQGGLRQPSHHPPSGAPLKAPLARCGVVPPCSPRQPTGKYPDCRDSGNTL